MKSVTVLGASGLALAAALASAPCGMAAVGGHGGGVHGRAIGRSSLGGVAGGPGAAGENGSGARRTGWGGRLGYREGWRRFDPYRPRDPRRGYGYGAAYPALGYVADALYDDEPAQAYGPESFGPQEPYGPGWQGPPPPPPFPHPPATALAPLAYGPGPHDGAYAYGYNGYAQTPPLPIGFASPGWAGWTGPRCGC